MNRTSTDQSPPPDAGTGSFRALRVRNFRIYASANLVSLTGTWMQRIGQDWLVLQLSDDSGIALGLITALQFGPSLLLSMYGGVLADRYAKRKVLLVTQALMGVLALLLAVLVVTDAVALWHVFVLAGGLGSVSAIDAPVRQAFVSEMVGPALLTNAVSLNSTIFNGARLIGPAVAGLLIGWSGGDTAPAFFVNAASFAFTIAALAGMRAAELQPSPPVARGKGQLREGLRYTWAHPDLVLAMTLAFVIGTFGFNYQVTIALMAREQFDLGAEAFGLLSTTFAVGSLTGALLSTRRSVRPRQRFLVISAVVFGLLTVVAGLMPGYASFAVLLVPTGAAALVFSVANNSFVQLGVDPQMRGRVMALYFMCFMGGTPVGAPLIGWISEHLGAPWGLILGGAVCAVAGLGAAAWLARGRRVRLEGGFRPPRLRMRIGAPGTRVPSARLRAAGEAAAEQGSGHSSVGG
ncbi:MFS transporter [Blastococcus tunisiensis]|uniref:Predicted arabinose efflux permease, MFS family n=1 Tax=Blastococcus tunisiensis TaxID=1798228 RepID=A0A1I1Y996_9ACTN|nr:MFS transporter [Blastococcus sp. DSM 46838]SFE14703.1 Predicted arabinose efflux permease, MFS family [Blastococcus sp. DSM 46838]